jgi:hypothetical protein
MSDSEVVFDKRIQANIPSELKVRVRGMVERQEYESEAEVVRAALWRLVDGPAPAAPPEPAASISAAPAIEVPLSELHNDLKNRMDLIAWLLTVALMLMTTIACKLLRALGDTSTEPMMLLDQTLRTSVHEREAIRRKLALHWHSFNEVSQQPEVSRGTPK